MLRLLPFIAVGAVALSACGKKSGSSNGSAAPAQDGTAITDPKQLMGTWTYASQTFKSDGSQVALSGVNTIRFRANNTFIETTEASTFSYAGVAVDDSCTRYGIGKWQLTGSTLLLTDTVAIATAGKKCEGFTSVPSVQTAVADISKQAFMNGANLLLENQFTYQGADGTSQTDTVVTTMTQQAPEAWDGTGIDPAIDGTWTMSSAYAISQCGAPSKDNQGQLAMSGTTQVTYNKDGSYQQTNTGFVISTQPSCTATASGTLQDEPPYDFNMQQSKSSDPCIKDAPNPAGYVQTVSRTFVSGSGKLVSVTGYNEPESDCKNQVYSESDMFVFTPK